MNDIESAKKLESLISSMDLPWNRKREFNSTKLRWLQKNMVDKNATHKNYAESLLLIERLIKNG